VPKLPAFAHTAPAHAGDGAIVWASNHMQLVAPLNASMVYLFEFGRLAAEAREVLTREALARRVKYIFYWDDDTLIRRLLFTPCTSTWNPTLKWGGDGCVYDTGRQCRTGPLQDPRGGPLGLPGWSNAEPEEVFSCGGGCLLVRADAIRKMTQPYWADGMRIPPGMGGEEHRIVLGA